ncbi:MAG: hypothetical protein COZ18_16995 [Flexibacter sp. CG_4_10_14_3_um_filter_32_15]|nr:MAG: hypothetical protein COZ18_16995 [Flexibacter sp. CG_4_10_14_3_um_filter_32_15]
MRVFVLEDDFFIRRKLVSSCIKSGCEVIADVGDIDKETLQKAICMQIDLYILDIEILGNEKGGFEFAKKIHQQNIASQFVYVTNHKELMKESFQNHRAGYPIPYDFLSKHRLALEGYDECIDALVTKFSAHQPPKVKIDNKKIPIDDIMFVEIPYKGILRVYLKNGKFIPLETPLKNLCDPQSEYYIQTLIPIHKSLLVNEDFIVDATKDKVGEHPATLYFKDENGKVLERKTGTKNAVKLYKKYRKR